MYLEESSTSRIVSSYAYKMMTNSTWSTGRKSWSQQKYLGEYPRTVQTPTTSKYSKYQASTKSVSRSWWWETTMASRSSMLQVRDAVSLGWKTPTTARRLATRLLILSARRAIQANSSWSILKLARLMHLTMPLPRSIVFSFPRVLWARSNRVFNEQIAHSSLQSNLHHSCFQQKILCAGMIKRRMTKDSGFSA